MRALLVCPAEGVAISRGAVAGVGVLVSGMTTTVLRCWLISEADKTTQGRVLDISEPRVGSSCTQYTCPLCGRMAVADGVAVAIAFTGFVPLAGLAAIQIQTAARQIHRQTVRPCAH